RGPHVLDALRYYGRAAMGVMGLRALAVDSDGAGRVLERMRPFESSVEPSMRLVHALSKAIYLNSQGRGADTAELIESVISRLEKPRFAIVKISEQERSDLLSGALLLEGVNQCFRVRSRALSYARRLEELGTPLAIAGALRISLSYHALRGESELAAKFRHQLDLNAIQSGTIWQIDWISVPIEGLAAITWSDLVMLRRALDALDKLTAEVPSFANMRDTIRIGYHFRRADYAAAVRLGEAYMQAHPPFTLLGWATAYAQVALSYLELGQIERAYEICDHARGLLDEHHLPFVIHNSIIEAAYATILAAHGERKRGEALFRALMDRLRSDGEFTRAFLMHEYWIKVTRLVGDRPALAAAIKDMRDAALASGNPSAILLADSVCERSKRARSSPLPPANNESPEKVSATTSSDETVAATFLQRQEHVQRAQYALQMLAQYTISGEGYLFWLKHGEVELAASLAQRDPPTALARLLKAIPANDNFSQRSLNDGEQAYVVVRLHDAAASCIGMAAFNVERSQEPSIPEGLIEDIGRALAERAS
ncbi:MAG TPA: hypothetical protein VFN67_18465, partial [Polyangiales bacterium]|nr:hypothetical protein [Polyangiales bacterium]